MYATMEFSSVLGIASLMVFAAQLSISEGIPLAQPVSKFEGLPNKTIDCPANMIASRINDSASELICDCDRLSVYFASNDSCYPVFTRGPCPEQHYVYMESGDEEPKCVKNICKEKDQLPYRGFCHKLGEFGGPCFKTQYLNINPSSLTLGCAYRGRSVHIVDSSSVCRRGGRKDKMGLCRAPV